MLLSAFSLCGFAGTPVHQFDGHCCALVARHHLYMCVCLYLQMGAVSGWAQQQLLALAAERELTVQQQQQEQPPQPPPVGPKQ